MLKYIFCDFKRNNSFLSKLVMATYRFGNLINRLPNKTIRLPFWIVYKFADLVFVKTIASADIPATCKIGKNLYLGHGANGIVIHPNAVIGNNVTIYHQVTIGSNKTGNNSAPIIEDNVFIGVGAKILGNIIVGYSTKVGACTLVVENTPSNSTIVAYKGTAK